MECKHKYKIVVSYNKEGEEMISIECKKCSDYFVMTKSHFLTTIFLRNKIKKLLMLKNLM